MLLFMKCTSFCLNVRYWCFEMRKSLFFEIDWKSNGGLNMRAIFALVERWMKLKNFFEVL